ncbi:MAG: hypothetical protein WCD42_01955 [Rhizomicrobium sp.]
MAEKELSDRAFVDRIVQESRAADGLRSQSRIVPDLPAGLSARILAGFDATFAPRRSWSQRLADAIWPGAPLWQPGFALALALICGLGLGLLPSVQSGNASPDSSSLQQLTEATPALDLAGDI